MSNYQVFTIMDYLIILIIISISPS